MASQLTREKVINHAFKLAGKGGLQAVSLTRIANDLGVTQPALYRHVGGVDDLRRALTLRARELMANDLAKATSGLSGKEAIRGLAHAWRRDSSSHRALLMLPGEVTIKGDEALEDSVERIISVISGTLSELDLGADERVHAARSLRSALHGFSAIESCSGQSSEGYDEAFEQLLTLIWIGLQALRDQSRIAPWAALPDEYDDDLANINVGGRKGSERLTPDYVVDAAAELAETHGLDSVSITRVAKNLGVQQPALYRHVEGIEALWRALALRAQQSLHAAIAQAAIGRCRDEAICALAAAWRRYVLSNPGTYTSTTRVVVAEDQDLKRASDETVRLLALTLRGYALSSGTSLLVAECIRSALHGFCLLEKDGAHPGPHDIDESFGGLVNLLIAGIKGMVAAESVASDLNSRRMDSKKVRGA
ncbi:MAG: TetR/AcrR family transcriptional regulator [Gammaproteobacteria bacterium]|nr:TetR/AcrR family transcriptional regulator [Gammaproteobacteria bacterium]